MHITNVFISGFKRFSSPTNIALDKGMNVIVGDNGAGKSAVLEAIHLTLAGTFRGKPLSQALTEDMFNSALVRSCFSV